MYSPTVKQLESEKALNAQGFSFLNWIDSHDPEAPEDCGTMVFSKQGATRFGKEYREIAPDGSVN